MGNTASEIGNKRVILYTIHCKNCKYLEKKLQASGINYETCEDIEEMRKRGFLSAPMLGVGNDSLTFAEALKWLEGVNK